MKHVRCLFGVFISISLFLPCVTFASRQLSELEFQQRRDLILNPALEDDISRLGAIEAAGRNKESELVPSLLIVASDASGKEPRVIRYTAMVALGELKANEAIPLFRSIIQAAHTRPQSSWGLDTYVGYAFEALGKMESASATALLVDSIHELNQMDLDATQTFLLIDALTSVRASEALKIVTGLLESPSSAYKVRRAAIRFLSEIGSDEALNALRAFVQDQSSVADDQLIQYAKDRLCSSSCKQTLE